MCVVLLLSCVSRLCSRATFVVYWLAVWVPLSRVGLSLLIYVCVALVCFSDNLVVVSMKCMLRYRGSLVLMAWISFVRVLCSVLVVGFVLLVLHCV